MLFQFYISRNLLETLKKTRPRSCFLSVFKHGLSQKVIYWLIPVPMKLGSCHRLMNCNFISLQLLYVDETFNSEERILTDSIPVLMNA